MSDLGELYQQVILDHNRNPRNFKRLESANRKAEGNNPLCGDRIQVYVQLDGDTISDIGFQMPQGSGCAISKASASLMTDAVKGKSATAAETMFQAFRDMLAGGTNAPVNTADKPKIFMVFLLGLLALLHKFAELARMLSVEGLQERLRKRRVP